VLGGKVAGIIIHTATECTVAVATSYVIEVLSVLVATWHAIGLLRVLTPEALCLAPGWLVSHV
jgi:hypothetical protein